MHGRVHHLVSFSFPATPQNRKSSGLEFFKFETPDFSCLGRFSPNPERFSAFFGRFSMLSLNPCYHIQKGSDLLSSAPDVWKLPNQSIALVYHNNSSSSTNDVPLLPNPRACLLHALAGICLLCRCSQPQAIEIERLGALPRPDRSGAAPTKQAPNAQGGEMSEDRGIQL